MSTVVLDRNTELGQAWDASRAFAEQLNDSTTMGLSGLRIELFEIDNHPGPVNLEEVTCVATYFWGGPVELDSAGMVQMNFSIANMHGFERRGSSEIIGNIVNDPWARPGTCCALYYDKDLGRQVVVGFTSPLDPEVDYQYHGWRSSETARHFAMTVACAFADVFLRE